MKIGRVIFESVSLTIVTVLSILIMEGARVYIFIPSHYLPGLVEMVKDKDVLTLVIYLSTIGLIIVGIEEIIFRLVPYLIFKKTLKRTSFWILGVVMSVIFAIAHTSFKYGFNFPLFQFVAAMYFWSLIRYPKGYGLAVVSHLIYNSVLMLVGTVWG